MDICGAKRKQPTKSIQWDRLRVGEVAFVARCPNTTYGLAYVNGRRLGRKFSVEMVGKKLARITRRA
jgi:hypothetical protein